MAQLPPDILDKQHKRHKSQQTWKMAGEVPVIIAMKGHPATGKSTLAFSLASALKIPLIDKDDVRDSTLTVQTSFPGTVPLLNDMSYEAVWRIVSAQLRLGLSVVVDSPLSRRAHLDCLLRAAAECGGSRVVVVVVECKPGDEQEWRKRLERRGRAESGSSWHKPSTWRDMERLLERYGGCTEYEVGNVPKVVVDTTAAGVSVQELVSSVVEFIRAHTGQPIKSRHVGKSM